MIPISWNYTFGCLTPWNVILVWVLTVWICYGQVQEAAGCLGVNCVPRDVCVKEVDGLQDMEWGEWQVQLWTHFYFHTANIKWIDSWECTWSPDETSRSGDIWTRDISSGLARWDTERQEETREIDSPKLQIWFPHLSSFPFLNQ